MADTEQSVQFVLRLEDSRLSGEITTLPGDRGGATRFGLASRFHPGLVESGYFEMDGDAPKIPHDEALAIAEKTYEEQYAAPLQLVEIKSQDVANRLLSFAVNEGATEAVAIAQLAAGSLGTRITVDGVIGPVTLAAINAVEPDSLIREIRYAQRAFYQTLSPCARRSCQSCKDCSTGLTPRKRKNAMRLFARWFMGLLSVVLTAIGTGGAVMFVDPSKFNFTHDGMIALSKMCAIFALGATFNYLQHSPLSEALTQIGVISAKTVNVQSPEVGEAIQPEGSHEFARSLVGTQDHREPTPGEALNPQPQPVPPEINDMANILVNIEKGIEIGAEDALHWLSEATKVLNASPKVIAALGVLLGAISTAVTDGVAAAGASGLNIQLDEKVLADIKAVWPEIVSAFGRGWRQDFAAPLKIPAQRPLRYGVGAFLRLMGFPPARINCSRLSAFAATAFIARSRLCSGVVLAITASDAFLARADLCSAVMRFATANPPFWELLALASRDFDEISIMNSNPFVGYFWGKVVRL